MRSMISGSIAALRSSVTPSARTAVSRTCSVAPTLGYGSSMSAPCSPFGAERRMPLGSLSTMAPNLRSALRWKSIGRSPIRQPPRSGMNAWPSRCSSGPQKRIGMRDAPACASISSMCADTAPLGVEVQRAVLAVLDVHAVHLEERAHDLHVADVGTSRRMLVVSPRRAATIALVARFFAPLTSTRPVSGRPPRIARVSPDSSLSPDFGSAESLRSVFIRWDLTLVRGRGGADGLRGATAWLADGKRPRSPRLAAGLELRDLVFVAQREPDVVEPSRSRHLV